MIGFLRKVAVEALKSQVERTSWRSPDGSMMQRQRRSAYRRDASGTLGGVALQSQTSLPKEIVRLETIQFWFARRISARDKTRASYLDEYLECLQVIAEVGCWRHTLFYKASSMMPTVLRSGCSTSHLIRY